MPQQAPSFLKRILFGAIAMAPWALSLYLLYYLEYGEVWDVDTQFRSVIAVIVIASGMGLSFCTYSILRPSSKT
ncbi:MAG: hypothetical protein AB8B57_10805 [Congregibacter sp.]